MKSEHSEDNRVTGAICDGFTEGTDVPHHCPNCDGTTTFRHAAYYDLARCLSCNTVYVMELVE